MCTAPIIIRNPRYRKDPTVRREYAQKVFNSDRVPDNFILVPCGHCPQCRARLAKQLMKRCELESIHSKSVYFITLTVSDEYLPELLEKGSKVPGLFIRRLRSMLQSKFSYIVVPEFGSKNDRLHFHGLLYFPKRIDLVSTDLRRAWPYGFYLCEPADQGSARYVTKYTFKDLGRTALSNAKLRPYYTSVGFGSKNSVLKRKAQNGENLSRYPYYTRKYETYAGSISRLRRVWFDASRIHPGTGTCTTLESIISYHLRTHTQESHKHTSRIESNTDFDSTIG